LLKELCFGVLQEVQTKEIKNGRLAMVAFVGFIIQAQATGQGPLANLAAHLSNPFGQNITKNIGTCAIPSSVDVQVRFRPSSNAQPTPEPTPHTLRQGSTSSWEVHPRISATLAQNALSMFAMLVKICTEGCVADGACVHAQGLTIPLTCLWPGHH